MQQSPPLNVNHATINFQNMDMLQTSVYEDSLIFSHENRPKSQNFHDRERHVLLDLIKKETDIIENKRNDIDMITRKDHVWNKITAQFNSHHIVNQRDMKQLKACWKNMKSKARKIVADAQGSVVMFDQYDTVSPKVLEVLTQVHDVVGGKTSKDDGLTQDDHSTDIIIKQEAPDRPSVNQQNEDWQVHLNLDSSDELENSTHSESNTPANSLTISDKNSKETSGATSESYKGEAAQQMDEDVSIPQPSPSPNSTNLNTSQSDASTVFKINSISNSNMNDPDQQPHFENYNNSNSGVLPNQHIFNRRPILAKRPARVAVVPEQTKRALLQSMRTQLHENASPPARMPYSHIGGSHNVFSVPDMGYAQRMGPGPVFSDGCSQEQLNARLLEMAEAEHRKKMRILDLEEEVLVLKRRKIQQSIDHF